MLDLDADLIAGAEVRRPSTTVGDRQLGIRVVNIWAASTIEFRSQLPTSMPLGLGFIVPVVRISGKVVVALQRYQEPVVSEPTIHIT